jgi:photosystem II stability/assembly factor-like uncharacterized protein
LAGSRRAGFPQGLERSRVRRALHLAIAAALMLASVNAAAHDPSAYGGLFRSRDLGKTWLNADVGLFLNAALTVAVDPGDPNHLLMGTDIGLLRSRNGGRSWAPEGQGQIIGAVFAVEFLPDGRSALGAAPSGVFRFADGQWTNAASAQAAAPARAIVGDGSGRIYLLGQTALFASDDGGQSFSRVPAVLPEGAAITALAVARKPKEVLLAVIDGAVMASEDGGHQWRRRADGLGDLPIDTIALDPGVPDRIWAAGADRIYVSDDLGSTWRAVGQPLPEAGTTVRGIAADPTATTLVVTTARGLFRSVDRGSTWALTEGNLPAHLEAGPLLRDPSDARTLYAGYSLMPYAEVWRTALEGSNLLARTDPISLAGGLAFVLLLIIIGALLVRWLARLRSVGAASGGPSR